MHKPIRHPRLLIRAYIPNTINRPGDSLERMHAYQDTLRAYDLPLDPRLITYGSHADNVESGRQAMRQILSSGAPCTAVITFNDWFAIGALEVIRASGSEVPRDFAVIGGAKYAAGCAPMAGPFTPSSIMRERDNTSYFLGQ